MANQQTRRRRKRYQPGSAYAGDVRPRGVFRVFGNVRLFFLVGALIMVGSLFIGGIVGSGALNGSSNPASHFVEPEDSVTGTPAALQTVEVRHYTSAPPLTIDTSKRYTATIKTSLGDIQVELFADQVPQTVNNFVFLAGDGFYNGLTFYQVFSDPPYAQAGDPGCQTAQTTGTCRGSGDPGYQLAQEKPGPFDAGTIGMANASQFFIALSDASRFSQYTPFGRVTSGLDVAQKITQGTAIESVTISEQ